MKRKILVIGSTVLALVVLGLAAAPAFAANGVGLPQPAQITTSNKEGVLVRLLLVQDEAKVDAFIAKAENAGKLTDDQGVKVKEFWADNHANFFKNIRLVMLLRAKDESKVQAYLDKAVASGKIQQAQADKVIELWEIVHAPRPVA